MIRLRIEVDPELAKVLDEIKQKEYAIYGRGHTETVRFLANYYQNHKPLEKLLSEFQQLIKDLPNMITEDIDHSLDLVFLKAMSRVLQTLMTMADRNHPVARSPGALQESRTVR